MKYSPYVCLLIPQLTILIQIDSRISNIDHDFVDVYDVSRNNLNSSTRSFPPVSTTSCRCLHLSALLLKLSDDLRDTGRFRGKSWDVPWILPSGKRTQLSRWWLTYPSEKYESQLGLLFRIYGKS